MITKQIEVNGTSFHIVLTDQIINQVNNLKSLYSTAYEDPESFEQVSSQISLAINEIATAAEPKVSDSDLDGLIQEIIKEVENKDAEIEKQLNGHSKSEKLKKTRKKIKIKVIICFKYKIRKN